MIVNSKHTCSYFHILSEWRAPSGLADRPAVGGLRPTGGAGESCLWKKVTESTHWETYPKHSYWECLCESQLTLHGRKAHVLIGERSQGLLKPLLWHFNLEFVLKSNLLWYSATQTHHFRHCLIPGNKELWIIGIVKHRKVSIQLKTGQ